jgi:integrase/outer membrane murein-binding lipoprotein Lpp
MSLKWLETYSSPNTVRAYKWGLEQFFECLGFKGSLEENAEAYMRQKRNYEEDVKTYFASLKGKPPKSVNICLTSVKMFLMENGVELSALFWRRLQGRNKGKRALMLDKVPSNAELRRILSHMDVKGKSLFLVLASSGMRIGEALKLKVEDVDLTSDPPKINIRGEYTKTGNPRVAFISSEAKEFLQEWLKIRNSELETAIKRSRFEKAKEDRRIWAFETTTAYYIWRSAIAKSGFANKFQYNNGLERYTVHPHVLRKFFRTRMASAIPVDVTEALMGHEGYLTEVYRRYSLEELAKFYKQGEHTLLVFAESENVSRLRAEIEEKNKQLQTLVNGLTAENMELKAQINALKNELERFKQEVYAKIDEATRFISALDRGEKWAIDKLKSNIKTLDEETKRLEVSKSKAEKS